MQIKCFFTLSFSNLYLSFRRVVNQFIFVSALDHIMPFGRIFKHILRSGAVFLFPVVLCSIWVRLKQSTTILIETLS